MNPELQRNLTLELTPRRLTWALVAVGLTYLATLVVVNLDGSGGLRRHVTTLGALGFVGGWMFVGACLVWGARQASAAVVTEVGERTWDFQRMSALSPWTMTWGKLFGVTSLSWIIGLIGLALFTLNGLMSSRPGFTLQLAAIGLAGAVLLQAGGVASSLIGVRRARVEGRLATLRNRRSAIIGVVALIAAANGVIRGSAALRRAQPELGGSGGLAWWGVSFPWETFALFSLAIFAAWAVVGAWRLMRLELQSENSVWLWAGFVLFCGLYAAGFGDVGRGWRGTASNPVLIAAVLAGGVFCLLAYIAAFADPADRQRLGAFRQAIRERRWTRASVATPLILPPLLLAVAAWLVATFAGPDSGSLRLGFGERFSPGGTGLAILLFTLRDLGVIAWARFSPRPRRSDAGAIVALVLLYVVGGALLGGLMGEFGRALTSPFGPAPMSILAGGAEAVAVWWFAAQRIFGRVSEAPSLSSTANA